MTNYEKIKSMTLDEMAKEIIRLSVECSSCEGGCENDDYDCVMCTRSRLRYEESENEP